ncbi:hypothetical protein Trydic_g6197 [Trypoxylus dichotomus]
MEWWFGIRKSASNKNRSPFHLSLNCTRPIPHKRNFDASLLPIQTIGKTKDEREREKQRRLSFLHRFQRCSVFRIQFLRRSGKNAHSLGHLPRFTGSNQKKRGRGKRTEKLKRRRILCPFQSRGG